MVVNGQNRKSSASKVLLGNSEKGWAKETAKEETGKEPTLLSV